MQACGKNLQVEVKEGDTVKCSLSFPDKRHTTTMLKKAQHVHEYACGMVGTPETTDVGGSIISLSGKIYINCFNEQTYTTGIEDPIISQFLHEKQGGLFRATTIPKDAITLLIGSKEYY